MTELSPTASSLTKQVNTPLPPPARMDMCSPLRMVSLVLMLEGSAAPPAPPAVLAARAPSSRSSCSSCSCSCSSCFFCSCFCSCSSCAIGGLQFNVLQHHLMHAHHPFAETARFWALTALWAGLGG